MSDPIKAPRSFQEIILRLQTYWAAQGCAVLQPYDMEVGAGTFHPATTLRSLGSKPWAAAYVQPSRRPTDGRYGENPNRLQHYYQYQVIIKPSPANLQDLIAALKQGDAELGLAFDGDGDRLGVVTRDGHIIYPDRQLMMFAQDVLSRNPGAQIIYDVKNTIKR